MTPEIAIVQDNRSGRLSYWQGSDHHGMADRHGVSLAPYIHALFGLIRQKKSRHVLIIGGGAGSLATLLARRTVKVTLVDLDPQSFEIARHYFHMPVSVECRVADGAKFLRRNCGRYDAIVLDAFAEGEIPRHFLTPAFLRLAKVHLRRGGMVLINLVISRDDDPLLETMARAARLVWRTPAFLDGKSSSNRNVILAAGAVKTLRRPRLLVAPAVGRKHLVKALAEFSFSALR